MGNENKKKDTNKPVLPNQAMLFLRGAIGFYLMYLAYELIRDESRVAPRPVIIICAILSFLITRKDGGRLMKWKSTQKKVVWELMYVFAGGLALGTLVSKSGAAENIGGHLGGYLHGFRCQIAEGLRQSDTQGLVEGGVQEESGHADGQRSGIQVKALVHLGGVGKASRQEKADNETHKQGKQNPLPAKAHGSRG